MNRSVYRWALALALPLIGLANASAQTCLTMYLHSPVYDNYMQLVSTGTDNPPYQYVAISESGGGVRDNELYAADDGSSSTGDTYSYGATGSNERALGTLRDGDLDPLVGRCYTNVSGYPINAMDVVYTTEQWRRGAAGSADRLDFQYSIDATGLNNGTWYDYDALDSTTIAGTAVGALDGNDPANQEIQTGRIPVSIPAGGTFFIRWRDVDAVGEDDGLAVDELWVTARGSGGPCCGGAISVGDATVTEGDDGVTYLEIPATLNRSIGEAVYFNFSTQDGSATGGSDYVAVTEGVGTIPAGSMSATISIAINGDMLTEGDETLLVNISNVTGNVVVLDAQGTGVIQDNDLAPVAIHSIQGSGAASPLLGQLTATEGVVTLRKPDGFFIQAVSGTEDADAATSEGLFVQTVSAPPAAAAIGNKVRVVGTVAELVSPGDAALQSMTALSGTVTVSTLATGLSKPTPVEFSATFPDPVGSYDQLERLEGMRVRAPSVWPVSGSGGTYNETSGIAISDGRYYATLAWMPRPYQQAGIAQPVSLPSGTSAANIPRWNGNPEVFAVDVDGGGGALYNVWPETTITGLTGPLEFSQGRYTIVQDPAEWTSTDASGFYAYALTPLTSEFTVASFGNLRFFDDVDDPSRSEPVPMASAFAARLTKASVAIRENMGMPDIVVLGGVENLATLQQLSSKISTDEHLNGQPDPQYVAILEEGNGADGLDVGLLVKTGAIKNEIPRVEIKSVTQIGKANTWLDPRDNALRALNERPPLLLQAIVHYADGGKFPISVLAVNPRSREGIASEDADGLTTTGDRVRRMRQAQAQFLADEIQRRHGSDPSEHLLVIGDFDSLEVNDGYADVLNTVIGTPAADSQTAVPGDGADLVEPNLTNLLPLEKSGAGSQRIYFSAIDHGTSQAVQHALVNDALLADAQNVYQAHVRINAERPVVYASDSASLLAGMRLSDRDPLLAYIAVTPQKFSDLWVEAINYAYAYDGRVDFVATMHNSGPDIADYPAVALAFNAPIPDLIVSPPSDWTCDRPQIANGMTSVACTNEWQGFSYPPSFVAGVHVANLPDDEPLKMVVSATSLNNEINKQNNVASTSAGDAMQANMGVIWTAPATVSRSSTAVSATLRVTDYGVNGQYNTVSVQPVVVVTADVPRDGVTIQPPYDWKCKADTSPSFKAFCRPTTGIDRAGAYDFAVQIAHPARPAKSAITLRAQVSSFSYDPLQNDNYAETSIQLTGTR